jgi:ribosomal protein S18 acetylase RimI-like enzyme
MPPDWRPLTQADLADVARIAGVVHPDLPERREVFAEKRRLFPTGCFAFETEEGVAGYAVSHPWTLGDIPPLDGFLGSLPSAPDCLYLHDVALLPSARGSGAAAALVSTLTRIAGDRNLPALALVSVYGANRLWSRLGFDEAAPAKDLAAYGPTARYMIRRCR